MDDGIPGGFDHLRHTVGVQISPYPVAVRGRSFLNDSHSLCSSSRYCHLLQGVVHTSHEVSEWFVWPGRRKIGHVERIVL